MRYISEKIGFEIKVGFDIYYSSDEAGEHKIAEATEGTTVYLQAIIYPYETMFTRVKVLWWNGTEATSPALDLTPAERGQFTFNFIMPKHDIENEVKWEIEQRKEA
jgi:hypothetical protein